MATRRNRTINLPAPYLRRVWLNPAEVSDPKAYPFCLPFLVDGFELNFEQAITIIVGENGTGKSTLLEGIAVLAGFDEAGGGKGYRPVDHSNAREVMGGELSSAMGASWLPKISYGWFFRAESFFSVARYLDESGSPTADFLSYSHGEGFMRFFEERCQRQGIFIFDEPESALSPARQMEFLKLMRRMDMSGNCQIIMATHSPMLMAYPQARLLRLSKYGLEPVTVEQTDHYRVLREFCADPAGLWKARSRSDRRNGVPMASRRNRPINLPAPYLRRVWLDAAQVKDPAAYPFCLPFLQGEFELELDRAVTIIVGENGTGKSTLLEGIAVLAGYDEAGGGKGYATVDHSWALEKMGGQLSNALRASWLPKITNGWFFRAESFFSVARHLDEMAQKYPMGCGPPPDFLSHSHGEGFLRFFQERCQRQGIFIFDEPESALSPSRQIEFLKLLRRMDQSGICQVIMATHSPVLMAYPQARLLRLSKYGLEQVTVRETDHYKVMREFCADPDGFVQAAIEE